MLIFIGSIVEALPKIFDRDEWKECLEVTTGHAVGLVSIYALYVFVSAYFEQLCGVMCCCSASSETPLRPITDFNRDSKSPLLKDVEDLSINSSTIGSDATAALLAAAVEGSILPRTLPPNTPSTPHTYPSQSGQPLLSMNNEPSRIPGPDSYRNDPFYPPAPGSSASMSLLRQSYQLQRSSKYLPSGQSGSVLIDARKDRLAAVDWSASKAAFVMDSPLYTWRSSSVRFELLEPIDVEEVITNDDSAINNNALCSMCYSGSEKREINTHRTSSAIFSCYLYSRRDPLWSIPCLPYRWDLRYYAVDRWGLYSRKARMNAPRGPHLILVDLTGVSSVQVIDEVNNTFEIVYDSKRSYSNGLGNHESCRLVYKAPTREIMRGLLQRLEAYVEVHRLQPIHTQKECMKIAA
jgi:hypothetical protein